CSLIHTLMTCCSFSIEFGFAFCILLNFKECILSTFICLFLIMLLRPLRYTLFPYTTLFRSHRRAGGAHPAARTGTDPPPGRYTGLVPDQQGALAGLRRPGRGSGEYLRGSAHGR